MSATLRRLWSIRYGPAALHIYLYGLLLFSMFVRGEAAAGSFLWPLLFFADLPVAILAFGIGGSLNPDNPVSISLTIWAILGTLCGIWSEHRRIIGSADAEPALCCETIARQAKFPRPHLQSDLKRPV